MTLIRQLREKVSTDQFELSKHAVDQSFIRPQGSLSIITGGTVNS
jgi:hypothetical protein